MASYIGSFSRYARKYGLAFALKYGLSQFLDAKVYIAVRYPVLGTRMLVRPHWWWRELEAGKYEPNCIRQLCTVVKHGDTVLDIGAWAGLYALLFSELVGPTGSVYAFEPDPVAHKYLIDNVTKNGLLNVKIERSALSNSIGEATLRSRRFGRMGTSLMPTGELEKSMQECVVRTTTVDSYCEQNRVVPNGLKIDVEGAENSVIEGASRTIRQHHPWVVLEFHSGHARPEEQYARYRRLTENATEIVNLNGDLDTDRSTFHVFLRY